MHNYDQQLAAASGRDKVASSILKQLGMKRKKRENEFSKESQTRSDKKSSFSKKIKLI